MADKYDVFVGNLTFVTTEEQLREKFSFVGPVKNIRILTDKETGKPKGFAFVEYFDTNTALSAIRHLDQTELNGRKIKVGYPAQSNLKDIARQIGQVGPETAEEIAASSGNSAVARQRIEQSVVDSLQMHEAWDILEAMKKLITADSQRGQKAKAILETHPQLISAIYSIQQKLGIVLPAHLQQQQDAINETQDQNPPNPENNPPTQTQNPIIEPPQPPLPPTHFNNQQSNRQGYHSHPYGGRDNTGNRGDNRGNRGGKMGFKQQRYHGQQNLIQQQSYYQDGFNGNMNSNIDGFNSNIDGFNGNIDGFNGEYGDGFMQDYQQNDYN